MAIFNWLGNSFAPLLQNTILCIYCKYTGGGWPYSTGPSTTEYLLCIYCKYTGAGCPYSTGPSTTDYYFVYIVNTQQQDGHSQLAGKERCPSTK